MTSFESVKKFLKANPVTSPFYSFASCVKRNITASVATSLNTREIKHCRETLKQYKNRYEGQRCFIIGNGPSLKAEDLDRIKGEVSFASNRIYVIFNDTDWRPTFYVNQDHRLIVASAQKISDIRSDYTKLKIIPRSLKCGYPHIDGTTSLLLKGSPKFLEHLELPDFSPDITDCVYDGMTITYTNMQIAAYMGFKEIILLGVDHHYSMSRKMDGTIVRDDTAKAHFKADYFGTIKLESDLAIASTETTTLSYISARKYAEQHGVRILNATRGGKLEVFERVNFDDIVGG